MPDTQTLGLAIAAALAVLICGRLYWILGRKSGIEPRPAAAATAIPAATKFKPGTGNGLLDIQAADRDFDTQKFLVGAREAYSQIITAFANGDRAALAPLLSPDVLAAFETAISARTAPPAAFVTLSDGKVSAAALTGRHAEITVTFVAQFVNGAVTDVWTFARDLDAANPNWLLVGTSGDVPE